MAHATKQRRNASGLISASEIACWAYCPEQWRLQYGLGLPTKNQKSMDAGTRHHRGKEAAERWAGRLAGAGLLLVAFGLMALLWMIWGKG